MVIDPVVVTAMPEYSQDPRDEAVFDGDCATRGTGDAATGAGYSCVSLLYGTNRAPVAEFGGLDEQDVYSTRPHPGCEPGVETRELPWCRLGVMTVSVPDSRERGDPITAVARNDRDITDEERARLFSVWSYAELDARAFAGYAQVMLEEAIGQMDGQYDNQAIVFIHGFNVRFRDAAFRAAQIKYDLQFPGPVFFYSWPANGSVFHYLSDMDDADLSVDALVNFLLLVRAALPDAEINVVAHSMGTRVFAQALSRLELIEPGFEFGHVFFASGDLDRNLFLEWAQPAAWNMESLTLYTSSTDVAVASSALLRNLFPSRDEDRDIKERIGFFQSGAEPPVFNFEVGWDDAIPHTIDMTEGEFSFLGFATRSLIGRGRMRHSEYMERTPIIEDMSCILRFGAISPEERHSGMRPRANRDGFTYWVFDEDGAATENCPPLPE